MGTDNEELIRKINESPQEKELLEILRVSIIRWTP